MTGNVEALPAGEQEILDIMRPWGYQFSNKSHQESPGYKNLMIALRETPTRMHYDPEVIRVQMPGEEGVLNWMSFHIQQRSQKRRPIGFSRIILRDRKDKAISFFAFGGTIESIAADDVNVFIVKSDAPIIDLTTERDVLVIELAHEADILIARIKAKYGADEQEFLRRLNRLPVKVRYAGSIYSMMEKLRSESILRPDRAALLRFLQREVRFLKTSMQVDKPLESLLEQTSISSSI